MFRALNHIERRVDRKFKVSQIVRLVEALESHGYTYCYGPDMIKFDGYIDGIKFLEQIKEILKCQERGL